MCSVPVSILSGIGSTWCGMNAANIILSVKLWNCCKT